MSTAVAAAQVEFRPKRIRVVAWTSAVFLVAGAVQTAVWLGTRYSPLGRA